MIKERRTTIDRYVRIENSKLYLFLILILISFNFNFWDLELEFNMMTHVTVTNCHKLVTVT